MTLFVDLEKDLEKKFRMKATEKFGGKQGPVKLALEEAIKLWLKS